MFLLNRGYGKWYNRHHCLRRLVRVNGFAVVGVVVADVRAVTEITPHEDKTEFNP